MHSILFVCTGNHYRSQVSAQVFREQLVKDNRDADWIVNSAGTWTSPGQPVMPDSVQLAHSFGLDISEYVTQVLTKELLETSDLVLVMETGHKESIQVEFPFVRDRVFLISEVIDGITYDIPDPASAKEEAYEIIRDLVTMIRAGAGKIYNMVATG